ncbi:hypothetical protein ABTX81_20145 [Kitasatospora sp. NPDC097605]
MSPDRPTRVKAPRHAADALRDPVHPLAAAAVDTLEHEHADVCSAGES